MQIVIILDFEGKSLVQAIEKTFKHRKTPLPESVPFFSSGIYDKDSVNNARWKAFLSSMQIKNAPAVLGVVAQAIESFLLDPAQAIHAGRNLAAHWHAPGPWH